MSPIGFGSPGGEAVVKWWGGGGRGLELGPLRDMDTTHSPSLPFDGPRQLVPRPRESIPLVIPSIFVPAKEAGQWLRDAS